MVFNRSEGRSQRNLVVVHELELAINGDLYGCLWILDNQHNVGSLLWHTKLCRHLVSMPINDRRLIKPVMLICFSSAKILL